MQARGCVGVQLREAGAPACTGPSRRLRPIPPTERARRSVSVCCSASQAAVRTHVRERELRTFELAPGDAPQGTAPKSSNSRRQTSSALAVRTLEAPVQELKVPVPVQAPICTLTPDTFGPYVMEQPLVLVDFYTDWCGPCQLMHKELEKLAQAFPRGVAFAKFDCGLHEEYATQQRIRSLPTFKLFKGGRCVEQLSGAKPQQLRQLLAYYYRPG